MATQAYRASMPQAPRKYAVHELLAMRLTLPFVSCPLHKFTKDAWAYGIIKTHFANQPNTARWTPPTELDQERPEQHKHQPGGYLGGGGVRSSPTPVKTGETGGARGRGGGHGHVAPSGLPSIETPQMHQQPTLPYSAPEYRSEYKRHLSSPMATTHTPMTPMQSHMAPMQSARTSIGDRISPDFEPMMGSMDPLRQGILHNIARFYPHLAEIYATSYRQLQSATPSLTAQNFQAQQLLAAQQLQAAHHYQSLQSSALYSGFSPSQPAMPTFEQRLASMSLESPISQRRINPVDLSGGYPAVTIGATGYARGLSQGFVPGGTLKTVPMTALTPTLEIDEPKWDASTAPARPQFDPSGQKSGGRRGFKGQADTSELFPQPTPKNTGSRGTGRQYEQFNPKNTGPGGTSNGRPEQKHNTQPNTPLSQDKANIQGAPATDKGKAREVIPDVAEEILVPPPAMLGASSAREHQLAFIQFMKMKSTARSKHQQQLKENMNATSAGGSDMSSHSGYGSGSAGTVY